MMETKKLRGASGLMGGRQRRAGSGGKLNLVALMDIFTILVFFLMVNSSNVQVLQQHQSVTLPESVAEQTPQETVLVLVTDNDIVVQGKSVANPKALPDGGEAVIPGLKAELDYQAQRYQRSVVNQEEAVLPITIMGDSRVPYAVLKRIMATCSETPYRNVSLAVSRVYDVNGVAAR